MPKVVLIDDEQMVAETYAAILRHAGYQVSVANDGERGVQLVREILPDVVVSDIRLPGIDGHEVVSMLKAQPATARIPVILISGHGSPSKDSCDAFLAKPFLIPEFLATVERLATRGAVPS